MLVPGARACCWLWMALATYISSGAPVDKSEERDFINYFHSWVAHVIFFVIDKFAGFVIVGLRQQGPTEVVCMAV